MNKIAVIFVIAVLVPSLVLAWLAVRSIRDQQFLLERQQSLFCQGISDSLAKDMQDVLTQQQHEFNNAVAALIAKNNPSEIATSFDQAITSRWPLAELGFAVTLEGEILSPPSNGTASRKFLADNGRFLANRESAEVYLNPKQVLMNSPAAQQPSKSSPQLASNQSEEANFAIKNSLRNVIPQQQLAVPQALKDDNQQQFSKLASSEAEFRQLVGDDTEGAVARFVDNKLSLLYWCRSPQDPRLIFGAQVSILRLRGMLTHTLEQADSSAQQEFCLALLDESARPVALTAPRFSANWRRPFVATEIGDMLPHWETAVYLLDPAKLNRTAQNVKLTLGLLVSVLLLAIGIGSWLIGRDLNRELTLARQKTDFVSNVSHELKTPLTSIRMFSELLAEGRVADREKQRSYLGIITAETARLTRLINNVLDFARMERGEKKYDFKPFDFVARAKEVVEGFRPNLEAGGFSITAQWPDQAIMVKGDPDALAQVIVNLLSNAEKYSNHHKEIAVALVIPRFGTARSPKAPALVGPHRRGGRYTETAAILAVAGDNEHIDFKVMDRGPGVPRGCEEKIFEKFYRAHDSLSSGIQGSGLGLTLARQIARAHGGDVIYEPREGGGSSFCLRLPVAHDTMT